MISDQRKIESSDANDVDPSSASPSTVASSVPIVLIRAVHRTLSPNSPKSSAALPLIFELSELPTQSCALTQYNAHRSMGKIMKNGSISICGFIVVIVW